jgi:hypothetical protein
VMDAKRAVTQVATTISAVQKRTGPGPSQPPVVIVEKKDIPIQVTERKKDDSKARFSVKDKGVNSKIPNSKMGGKKEPQMTGPSAPEHPKSFVSTRSAGQRGTEAKTSKKDEPRGVPSAVRKVSQSANGDARNRPSLSWHARRQPMKRRNAARLLKGQRSL